MFHASVETERDTFHFIAELDPYNLETLQQYVRSLRRESGLVRLRFEIGEGDKRAFILFARSWLKRLQRDAGVDVHLIGLAAAPPRFLRPTWRL